MNGKSLFKGGAAAAALSFGLLAAPSPADAATTSVFVQIAGLTGETQDVNHRGWSDVYGFSWGDGDSRPITFQKPVDRSTPNLAQDSTNGAQIQTVTFNFARQPQTNQSYLAVTLTGVVVRSDHVVWSQSASAPLEHVSLDWSTMQITYRPTNNDGTLGAPVTVTINHGGRH